MAILVTGGCGYIGSVTIELLQAQGEAIVVLDNLSRGHRAAVDAAVAFYQGDVGDRALVANIAREHDIESCIHFAAFAYVGESVNDPALYYKNNVEQGIALFETLVKAGVRQVVFSSTCSTYGEVEDNGPISEQVFQQPTNPYGWSKLFIERLLQSFDQAYGLKFVALRYFNAAGATAQHGERHDPETHLIPNVLAAAHGALPYVSVFGNDYPTPDGTPIRDYVHVADLGQAHTKALAYLRAGNGSDFFNLGNNRGFSVLEVIEAARQVTGLPIDYRIEPARPGDPSHLVAAAEKARRILSWQPSYTDLEAIIRTAWEWRLKGSTPSGQI